MKSNDKGQERPQSKKVNNYVNDDQPNNLQPHKTKSIGLSSKFQSAPSTPTKVPHGPNRHDPLRSSNQRSMREGARLPAPKEVIEKNVITKYAFATRVGFMPNNPNKVN
jgi:hypothetical protein